MIATLSDEEVGRVVKHLMKLENGKEPLDERLRHIARLLGPKEVAKGDEINKYHYPTREEFISYGLNKGNELRLNVCRIKLNAKFEAWEANDWKTGHGRKIKNWRSTLLNTLPFMEKPAGDSRMDNLRAIR